MAVLPITLARRLPLSFRFEAAQLGKTAKQKLKTSTRLIIDPVVVTSVSPTFKMQLRRSGGSERQIKKQALQQCKHGPETETLFLL